MKKKLLKEISQNIIEPENPIQPLYEYVPVAYQTLDVEGKILEVNHAWLEQFGFQTQEVIGHYFAEFLTPQFRKSFPSLFSELIKSSKPYNVEYDLTKRNGEIITVLAQGTVLNDKQGAFKQTHCILHNITERKRSETLNRVLLEIMQGVVVTKDLHALLALIHRSISNVILAENFFVVLYNKKTGLFEEVYTVDKYDSPAPPSNLEKSISSYVFRTRQPILCTDAIFEELIAKGEVELVGHNSSSWLGVPLNTSTETIGVMVLQDYEISNRYSERDIELLVSIAGQAALVVERLKAEEALIQSENLLRETQSIARLGSYILDVKTGIWDSSDILDSIFGIENNYIHSIEGWAEIIHPDDRNQMTEYFIHEVLGKKMSFDREYRIKRKNDQQVRWVHGLGKLEVDDDNQIVKMVGTIQDITERHQMEETLRQNEELYRLLAENASDVIWILDVENNTFRYISPSVERLIGFTPEEVLTQQLKPKYSPNSFHYYQSVIPGRIERFRQGYVEYFTDELELIHKDGHFIWTEVTARYVHNPISGRIEATGVTRDITERKRAEALVLESEERFRNVFENAAVGKSITSLDGNVKSNKTFCEIVGYSQEELSTLKWQAITHPDDIETDEKIFQSILSGQKRSAHWEKRYIHKNGNIVWVDISSTMQLDSVGKPQYFITTINDITERKRAEEALRESETQYSHLIETMEDGVYRSSHEGKFLEVNPAMVNILGYDSKEELMAIDIKTQLYFDAQDRESAALDEKLQEMAIFRLKKKDGAEVWVEDHGRHVTDDEGNVLYHEGVLRDITERMSAEQALRASEAELRSLFAAMNDIVLILDTEGKYLKIAPTNPSLLFKPSDELLGRKVHDVFPKHHADFFVEHIRQCLETKTVANVDYTIKIGEKDVYFYATVSPLTEDSVIWVGRDITERILVVNALRENEEQYRNVVTVSPDAIVIHCDGKIVFANPAAVTLVGGTSLEDILGKSPLDFVHPEEREFIRNRILKIAKGEMPSSWLEERFVKLDGSVINVEVISVQTPYQGKSATQVVVRDITGRKRTEKEINTLAHALRSISECVSITDMDNKLLFVNEAFLNTYEYEEQDLIGHSINLVYSPNNLPEVAQEIRAMTHKGGWRGEILNTKKDGTEFPIFLSTSIIRDDKEVPIALIGVATDITEIKNAEEKRKSLEVQLQQSQKLESLGTLASGIAHDFNNILGIIIGHASLLSSLPPDRTIIKKNADAITKASKRGAALVKQLLTFARKTDILVESIRLNDIIIEVSKLLGETFSKTINITLNLEDKLPSIIADATQIHQVILNLCVNARDAMPEGGTLSITTFKVSGDLIQSKFPKVEAKEYVALFVDDNGVGMDDETRRRIFEPFFTTKDIGKGTGLGLSMVFGIVESHNGFIDVHSELGKGTTFELYFPLPYNLIETDEPVEEQSDTNLTGNETILIIEDEELLRELLKDNLESHGYKIISAEDGEDGVLQYQQHQKEIQLVISDLGLPKLSGFEAFKKMKLLNPDIHFMIASGYIDPDEKAKMLSAGINNISPKPYSTEYLLRIARKILDNV